jgi:hypothetical protein
MQLTPQEQQNLENDQAILELRKSDAFQIYLARLQAAVARLEQKLLETRLSDWDQYLSFWWQKQALLSAIGEIDAAERESKALEAKALAEPDNSPATGELA